MMREGYDECTLFSGISRPRTEAENRFVLAALGDQSDAAGGITVCPCADGIVGLQHCKSAGSHECR